MKHQEEFLRKGFAFFDVGNDKLEVQKIDFPSDWEEDYELDFDIPILESDDEAKKLAEDMGYKFKKNTYEVLNYAG